MKKLLLASLLLPGLAFCQMKTLAATSNLVDIKDGEDLKKGQWTIMPEVNPDVFTTNNEKVTFITDKESVSVKLKAGEKYDFVVLLNGKEAHTRIERVPDYIDRLKKGAKYNTTDNRSVPAFTYQDMNDPNLVKLRKDYNLDSIAGQGNEVSKMINLMNWVHNTIRHDGSSNNPDGRNADNIIKVCKTEGRGVNCRMMATVLNECYLAMGFKSRYITCMPKELKFDDCHVINMVYSNELNKWVWMDPTFDAYVMDEKGTLLSVEEVRERLVKNKPLILNPDANWNRRSSQTKDYYLDYYMAKNLYRIQAVSYSCYDSETENSTKEIAMTELLPLDGLNQSPQKKEIALGSGTKFIQYITNNPATFWAKP